MILHTRTETLNIFYKTLRVLITPLLLISICAACGAQEKKKIAYGILLDNTGSMRSQFETVKAIAKAVARQIHNHGAVSLIDFASGGQFREARAIPTPRIERTQDQQLLEQTIDNLYVEGGQTTLLDAIQFLAERLGQQSSDTPDRVIILITDGEERSSAVKQKQLIEKLKEQKIRVYAIGLVQQLDSESGFTHPSRRSKAIELLKDLTNGTGGRAVFPKSDRDDLQRLLTELAIPVD